MMMVQLQAVLKNHPALFQFAEASSLIEPFLAVECTVFEV